MRFAINLLSLWFLSTSIVALDKPTYTDLEEALKAHRDSTALLHKADSFLHARRAYFIARQLFIDNPAELAPISHTYARAAARYQEPIALPQYQHTLDLLVDAHGADSTKLIPTLVDAAEEAIHRKEPEMAYAWLKKAGELLEESNGTETFDMARAHMGLARLYYDSGEYDRAKNRAELAIEVAEPHMGLIDYPLNAQLYFWHGQIMRRLEHHNGAEQSYGKALSIYRSVEPYARPVLSIHRHLCTWTL